jgi:hypothetical protein
VPKVREPDLVSSRHLHVKRSFLCVGSPSLTVLAFSLVHFAEDRNGGNRTLQRLTHEFSWHCPGELYRMCDKQTPHTCCRLQELALKGHSNSPEIPISEAEETGAVVFRYAAGFRTIMESMNRGVWLIPRASENETLSDIDNPLPPRERLSLPRRSNLGGFDSGYSSGGNPDASGTSIESSLVPTSDNSLRDQTPRLEEDGATRPTQPPKRAHRSRHKNSDIKDKPDQSRHPAPGDPKSKRSERVRFGFL